MQTVGHADLFQDTVGNWWSVALATRNATVNLYGSSVRLTVPEKFIPTFSPMGRETILVPVEWPEGISLAAWLLSLNEPTKLGEYPIFNGAVPGRVSIDASGRLPPARAVRANILSAFQITSFDHYCSLRLLEHKIFSLDRTNISHSHLGALSLVSSFIIAIPISLPSPSHPGDILVLFESWAPRRISQGRPDLRGRRR